MGEKAVIILSKIKTDGRDWHTRIQIRACLTFNLLWMADPRWWWDSAARFQTRHLFSFCSNVLCQLQLFYLVDNAITSKWKKKSIMKTDIVKTRYVKYIKPSPNIFSHSPSFNSFWVLYYYSTVTQMAGWQNNKSKEENIANTLCWQVTVSH